MRPEVGPRSPGKHFDGGGLPCAVGAEKSKKLSGRDAEIHVVNRNQIPEAARQIRR